MDLDFAGKEIVVMDATHGGNILARELSGESSTVTLVDCYRTLRDFEIRAIEEEGIEMKYSVEEVREEKYDLIISPVHCPFFNPISSSNSSSKILSHHEIAGILLENARKRFCRHSKFIEVTGLKGKTSAAFLLYEMLSGGEEECGKSILSCSLGIFYKNIKGEEEKIGDRSGITPAFALYVMREAERRGLDVDNFIFELSLGFTGAADINVLTNVEPEYNYKIAGKK